VKLQEVVHNLVDNAVKFTARGTIDIAARRGRTAGWVTIEVTDSGVGIRAEERESIFEAFRQVGTSSTRTTGGVGLGLSIVKQLAEALGGTVAVVSTLGAGSTFRVDVPSHLPAPGDGPTAVTALDQTARNTAALPGRTFPRPTVSHRPVNDPD
jgi:signal transduction histidine kinase